MPILVKKVAHQNRTVGLAAPIISAYFLLLIPYFFSLSSITKANDTEPKEEVFYYLHDHLGGIDVITEENGNVVERKDYLPYGEERMYDDNTDEDYGYTGKEKDKETGLYYYSQRYYDPKIGRFTQIDPLILDEAEKPLKDVLDDPQALNGYSYVLNNPIKYIDPSGKWGVVPGLGGMSHQILTMSALETADIDQNWKKEHYQNFVYGSSIYADFTVKFYGETDASFHSTTPADISGASELKERMMGHAKRFFESDNDYEFGRLLHLVEDSFCPSHVERDDNGKIKAFLDYGKQDKSKHTKGDNIDNADFSLIYDAVEATKTLIEYRSINAKWEDTEKYLDETVWELSDDATVGTAGKDYENE